MEPKDQDTLDQGNLGEAETQAEVKEYKLISEKSCLLFFRPFFFLVRAVVWRKGLKYVSACLLKLGKIP